MLDPQLQRQEHSSQIQEAGQGQTLDLGHDLDQGHILDQNQGHVQDQGHAHVQTRVREVKYPDQIQGHQGPDPGQGVVGVQGHSHQLI